MSEATRNGSATSPLPREGAAEQPNGSLSQAPEASQTAQDFIASQLQLEADAREALPYAFDTCTKELGQLRQNVYACLTCNPPPSDLTAAYTPAGVCYSCSISCHGEHELVELFSKRYFVCDCGTTRLPETSPCTLRANPETGRKGGVHSQAPAATNQYNHNFRNRFCGCAEIYDPHQEKGTMFQCLGLEGGCGEDWWHPECLIGLGRDWREKMPAQKTSSETQKAETEPHNVAGEVPTSEALTGQETNGNETTREEEPALPPGFPDEDDFDHLICYQCTNAFPFIKRYAGASGFTSVSHQESVHRDNGVKAETEAVSASALSDPTPTPLEAEDADSNSKKRKADELDEPNDEQTVKKPKSEDTTPTPTTNVSDTCEYVSLPPAPAGPISLFVPSEFREDLCRCPSCFPTISTNPQLLEEEESYEPPISEADAEEGGNGSVGSRSLLDRGEAALSNMDRVRAIEGVMAYNHVRDKVKAFLRPFAESGEMVGAEDIKAYFEKLRGDEAAIRHAAKRAGGGDDDDGDGDNRKEQSGY